MRLNAGDPPLDPGLQRVLARALAKEKEARYQSVRDGMIVSLVLA